MAAKLSKADQLSIIEQLRYGTDWPKIKQTILDYEYSMHPNKNSNNKTNANVIFYQIQTLKQKMQISEKAIQVKEKYYERYWVDQEEKQVGNQNQKYKKNKQKDQDHQFQSKDRYFCIDESLCFNCKKVGHQTQYCFQQRRCQYCLCNSHASQHCKHKQICYKCYEIGHSSQNCTSKQKYAYCPNCQRIHIGQKNNVSQCYSLTKGSDQKKTLFPTQIFYQDPQIICLKCNKFGHFYTC